jgi:uncharacterized RDD family membrane protein YckC
MDNAAVWKRILGGLIDIIVLIAITYVYAMFFGTAAGAAFSVEGWPALGLFAIGFLYFVALEAMTGKTVGKLLTGTRVVDASGGRIGWGKSFIRNLLRIVDSLPFFYIVGLIAIIASKEKQRVGDMAAKTFVVNG